MKRILVLALVLAGSISAVSGAPEKTATPDLAAIADGKAWTVLHATPEAIKVDGRPAVHLEAKGDFANGIVGLAWPAGVEFRTG